jgi:hypothetical protein
MPRIIKMASMFITINLALLLGFFRYLTGAQRGAWQRTARAGEEGGPAPGCREGDGSIRTVGGPAPTAGPRR